MIFSRLPLIALLFGLDQWSKWWVNAHLPLLSSYPSYPFGGIAMFKNFLGIDFAIVHATNKGAAWSLFSNYQLELVWVRIALIALLICYLIFLNKRPAWQFPLLLVIAGAVGNVVDYFVYGHVVDMLQFTFWGYEYPVFNIADSMIFVGIFWLFLNRGCCYTQTN